jgi:serine/threonine-protein kinase
VTPERLRQIEELYHEAREREPNERAAFLAQACRGDEELRQELDQLLAPDSSNDNILDVPAADLLARSSVAQLIIGRQIGPYTVEAGLGSGGMGQVYRAVDTRLKRSVAIKVAKENFGERFEREARAIAALNHPNVCTLYDVGPNYLVMELIEGPTLADRIQQGPVPLEEALGIAKQIAEALEAAHEKGVVHRDLKPGNVKIKPDGIVKVLDFGLAKVAPVSAGDSSDEATATLTTRAGMIMGTAAYMSPEQAQGKPADKRADIWAFGVVLYEMLAGQRVFQGETVSDTLAAVLTREPEWERVPAKVRRLLHRCLEKDPKRRLRDIGDAWSEIGREEEQKPQAAGPRTLPWVVAAVMAVVAAAVLWVAWRSARPVDRPLMRFSADLAPDAVQGANITAAISPDGGRLAFVARGPGGKEQLATRLLDRAQATLLPGTENATDPFFSPDGQWIGFFAEGKMKKISVQGGAAVTLSNALDARGASWGEDGSIVVTLRGLPDSGLSRVPEAGGTPQTITKPADTGDVTHRWPQILPGGRAVLFTGHTLIGAFDDASIEALSLKTGQWKVVQRGGYFGRYLPSGHLVYLRQGTLFAVGFDLDRLEVRGAPVPLLADVAGNATLGGGQYDVAWNGTLVYLSGKSSPASWPIVWMDGTGKTQPLLATPGPYFSPRFSPDGKLLALAVGTLGSGNIQVYDWQRDTMTRLTFTQTNVFPVWTLDGKHIVFLSYSPGSYSLRWIRADGVGETQLLLEGTRERRGYSFSPDGKRLAFAELVDTGFDLWTLPLDVSDPDHPKPGKPELFLGTPFNEQEPAFSPDGRWIAYTSNESGRSEVYVRPFPGGAPYGSGKWQISTGGGAHPIWSRNGRELFYESPDNHIMTAAYSAKADSFAADKPRPWSNTQIFAPVPVRWNVDLAPDGQRFAVIPRSETTTEQKGSVHVTVLLNFFDELRRRVPAGK